MINIKIVVCSYIKVNIYFKILKGEVNVTSGGMMITATRLKHLLPSDPYLQSSVGFVFKQREARIYSISRILTPLEYRIWIVIVVIFVLSIFIILLTKKFSRKWRHFFIAGRMNRTPILNMYQSMLGKSIPNRFIASGRRFGNFARTLTMFWILLWFFVRSLYEGALYTNLQRRSLSSTYDTIEKVRASGAKVITGSTTMSIMENIIEKDR